MFVKAAESLSFLNMDVFPKLFIADVLQLVKGWVKNKYLSIKYNDINRVITKKVWVFFANFSNISFLFQSQHYKREPPSIIIVDPVGSASFTLRSLIDVPPTLAAAY